jgi:hypothetical protein
MGTVTRLMLAALLCSLAVPALAEPDINSGNYMLPYCRTLIQDPGKTGPMSGFCAGVIETLNWTGDLLREEDRFCSPRAVTNGQARQVVVRYLESHPERLHFAIPATSPRCFAEGLAESRLCTG